MVNYWLIVPHVPPRLWGGVGDLVSRECICTVKNYHYFSLSSIHISSLALFPHTGSNTLGAGVTSVKWVAGTTYNVGAGVVGTAGTVVGTVAGTAGTVASTVGSGASAIVSKVATKKKEHSD